MKQLNKFMIIVLVAIGAFAIVIDISSLEFKEGFGPTEATQLFSGLFLIALILERALEVFIATWRGPEGSVLQDAVTREKTTLVRLKEENILLATSGTAAQKKAKAGEIDTTVESLDSAEDKLQPYKAETKRIALAAALTMGLLISIVGVRSLEGMVTKDSLDDFEGFQATLFALLDIFLTGALLAGGSEGIHKITQAFTDFFEASSKKAKSPGE
jgi:hypothetical protein